MKSPLMYQITEEACGAVAILNCISFLFDREEMPLEFLNIMSSYAVGCYDDEGNLSNKDFYENIMFFATSWLKDYAKEKHIHLKAKHLVGADVNLLKIRNCLLNNGCVDLKTNRRGKAHYITITQMDNEFMYVFDPYFKPASAYGDNDNIEVILDKPFYYNRKVKIEHFIREIKSELTLGVEQSREAILFYRDNAILQREFV